MPISTRTALFALIATIAGMLICPSVPAESPFIFTDRFEEATIIPGSSYLNDTGIDWCANDSDTNLPCPQSAFPAQDGDVGRDALARDGLLQKEGQGMGGFDFTKLDRNGDDVAHTSSIWSCVRDNHTGLVWEVKNDDSNDQQYHGHTYTWFSNDSDTNGGDPGVLNGGVCEGSRCDTQGYVEQINSEGLCGYDDWQLPTRMQLLSIRHFGEEVRGIDTDYFPFVTQSERVLWTASVYSGDSEKAWRIVFHSGDLQRPEHKSSQRGILLVRSGQ